VSLKARAIRAVSSALYRSRLLGPVAAAASYARPAAGFPILTFHRVNDDHDPFFPAVPTPVFEERMAYIARHYLVLTVEELVERMQRGAAPRNALAITFDDGYRDTLTHAAPVLARHGLRATIFLATGYIGTPEPPWFDRVAQAFKLARAAEIALGGSVLPLRSEADRLRAWRLALDWLKGLPDEERRRSADGLVAALRPRTPDRPRRVMLTWEEVEALRGLGFSVGAHTVTHPILSRMAPAAAREEIRGSRAAIENALGIPVRAFAYPNGGPGDYNQAVTALVAEAGFTCAATTRRGLNNSRTPVLELRRGGPWEEHLPTYALKLAYYRLAGA
jgi:peptidoglycan/xylan/chitin deacetylase (PgdA/CDA1 family)